MSDRAATARPVLAIDLGLDACVVVVGQSDADGVAQTLAMGEEPMVRGHQERIAPLVQLVMQAAGLTFSDLGRIGVAVGPGSFTGLRVAVSFARSLAMALDIDCVGFTTLAALARGAGPGATEGVCVVAIPTRQGQFYVEIYADGAPVVAADVLNEADIAARLAEVWRGGPLHWIGPGALPLSVLAPGVVKSLAWPPAQALLDLTLAAPRPHVPPRPLYLRAPDARTLAERQVRV